MPSKPPADTKPADPKDETQQYTGPVAGYEVIETRPTATEGRFIASAMYEPEDGTDEEPEAVVELDEAEDDEPAEPVEVAARHEKEAEPQQNDPARKTLNRKQLLVLGGAGLGVVVVLLVLWFVLGSSSGESFDLGPVNDATTGLTGHLLTEWNGRLSYKLALEPGDPSQLAHFRNAVYSSAHPLAFEIQIKDPLGAVLCRTMVLLRFDPLKNAAPAVVSNGRKMTADEMNRAQAEQALTNARLVSQELTREHGSEMFSNLNGPDGQVESLTAQGTLPCTRKQYDHAASWGITTNFPPLGVNDTPAAAVNTQTAKTGTARKRKPAAPVSHFSIEEEDAAVSYQAATGTLETRNGRRLLIDRKGSLANVLKSADLPLRIHFRCDQFGACTLAAPGGVQRAWLQR